MKKTTLFFFAICIAMVSFSQKQIGKTDPNMAFLSRTQMSGKIQNLDNTLGKVYYASSSSQSKVSYMTQNFDGTWLPTGWTQTILLTSKTWQRGNPSATPFSAVDPTSLYSAICPYSLSTTSIQNEWLKSPSITGTSAATALKLKFWAGFSYAYLPGHGGSTVGANLQCKISTNGGSTWTVIWDALSIPSFTGWVWREVTIDISSYKSAPFIVAWNVTGADGDLMGLDNISIAEPAAIDGGVTAITAPVSSCTALSSAENIVVTIKNNGTAALTGFPVSYKINNNAPVTVNYTASIAAGGTATYTFTGTNAANLSVPGNYKIKAYTGITGDIVQTNDTSIVNIYSGAASIPYSMGFETTENLAGWTILNSNSDASTWGIYTSAKYAHTGTQFAGYIYNSDGVTPANDWLFTKCISLLVGNSYQLKFYYRAMMNIYPEAMNVNIGTAATVAGMTTQLVDLPSITDTTYPSSTTIFTVPSSGNYYIGFHVKSAADMYDLFIDDITVTIAPLCPAPTALTATPTGYNASLSWTENGTATSWNIEWGPAGFTLGTGTQILGVTTNPKTLTGLIPLTCYDYYVQSNCGGGIYSPWSTKYNFCTTASCIAPSTLTATGITTNSAILGWTNPGGTLWDIEYGINGFTLGTGTQILGVPNPKPLTGLSASTAYAFYVRANCGGGDYSAWAGPFTFTTLCNAVNTFPFSEDFTAGIVPPNCWSEIVTNTSYNWKPGTITPGTADIEYDPTLAAQNEWLITPVLNFSGLSNPRLVFDWALSYAWAVSPNNNYDLNCKISTDGGATWPTTLWTEANAGVFTDWTTYTASIDLLAYAGQSNVKIAWQYVGADGAQAVLDNIIVEQMPSCLPPTAGNISNLTPTSVDLGWTDPTGTLWNIDWGLQGFNHVGGTTVNGLTTNTYSLTTGTLAPNTSYDFYVRRDCGTNGLSAWAGPFTFTTPCNAIALPFSEDFEAASTTLGCWSVQNIDGAGETWTLYTDNHTPGGAQGIGHNYGVAGYAESGAAFSPELILPAAANIELAFWSYNIDATSYGQNSVLVSTDGWQTSTVVWAPTSVLEATWEQAVVSLSAYAGSTIQLAFLYEGTFAHAWLIDDVTVYEVPPTTKTLTMSVLLEGLYDAATPGTMRKAQDWDINLNPIDKFPGNTADQITVELHEISTPYDLVGTPYVVDLSTTGNAIVTLPGTLSGRYYIAIKHRYSIQTWCADESPVLLGFDFTGAGPFYYDFTDFAAKAYGDNQKDMGNGYFAIFAGDLTGDGFILGDDMALIDNQSAAFNGGYLPEDINGDSYVLGDDMAIVDNNSAAFVGAINPGFKKKKGILFNK